MTQFSYLNTLLLCNKTALLLNARDSIYLTCIHPIQNIHFHLFITCRQGCLGIFHIELPTHHHGLQNAPTVTADESPSVIASRKEHLDSAFLLRPASDESHLHLALEGVLEEGEGGWSRVN